MATLAAFEGSSEVMTALRGEVGRRNVERCEGMETVVEGVKGVRGVGVVVVVLVVALALAFEVAEGSKVSLEMAGWFEDLEEMEAGSLLADLDDL